MDKIRLRIVSPESEVINELVDCVFLPGIVGEFEVLRNHAPLITSLTEGRIRYRKDGSDGEIAIASGFVEVLSNNIDICAELPR